MKKIAAIPMFKWAKDMNRVFTEGESPEVPKDTVRMDMGGATAESNLARLSSGKYDHP